MDNIVVDIHIWAYVVMSWCFSQVTKLGALVLAISFEVQGRHITRREHGFVQEGSIYCVRILKAKVSLILIS